MSEGQVSGTRLYLGNLPHNATKSEIEEHFRSHGAGEITEVKLMNGFGFIEYKDSMDARDVVPAFRTLKNDGTDFKGNRLVVQFARGNRQKETPYHQERPPPRPRRTAYRMSISGIPVETSWQDLKDFARQSGLDPVYSEVSRERDGKGFVEYETETDLQTAVEKLNGHEFKEQTVTCVAEIQPDRPPRDRYRSRSPPNRYDRRGPPGGWNDYDRRGPPRYRDRTPPRRGYYDERERYVRSPPPDYPPRRPYPEDAWGSRGGYPPSRSYEPEPYANGRGYDRPPSPPPRRPRSPGRYDAPYERRAPYW